VPAETGSIHSAQLHNLEMSPIGYENCRIRVCCRCSTVARAALLKTKQTLECNTQLHSAIVCDFPLFDIIQQQIKLLIVSI